MNRLNVWDWYTQMVITESSVLTKSWQLLVFLYRVAWWDPKGKIWNSCGPRNSVAIFHATMSRIWQTCSNSRKCSMHLCVNAGTYKHHHQFCVHRRIAAVISWTLQFSCVYAIETSSLWTKGMDVVWLRNELRHQQAGITWKGAWWHPGKEPRGYRVVKDLCEQIHGDIKLVPFRRSPSWVFHFRFRPALVTLVPLTCRTQKMSG